MMVKNPFLDPESEFDYDLKVKDVKLEERVNPVIPKRVKKNAQTAVRGDFSIEELADSYKITGVQHENEVLTLNFAKKLLCDEEEKTQDGWVKYSKNALKNDKFAVASASLYNSIFRTLFAHKDDTNYKKMIAKLKSFVRKVFAETYIHTLTRVNYKAQGIDQVVHNVGIPNQEQIIDEEIIGEEEWVKSSTDKSVYNALLGSDNVKEINAVYKWITGKDSYLWRRNQKGAAERAVVLGVGIVRFNFDAVDGIDGGWPAFGVRREKNFQHTPKQQASKRTRKSTSYIGNSRAH